ncbi:hypothetical protein RirG_006620 [Rhizophagus irregularis DAOM 197198w]|uniref:Uncharacterized protein n=1 Tax=Rhizophagus irregularis (strain DAOM 197198w) TaxID=1432141 RepID=A0A015LI13_RHIIW|nr:hypothetical protein RirG_006620 [Rhizophagus irregularis DAOM 197198w]
MGDMGDVGDVGDAINMGEELSGEGGGDNASSSSSSAIGSYTINNSECKDIHFNISCLVP